MPTAPAYISLKCNHMLYKISLSKVKMSIEKKIPKTFITLMPQNYAWKTHKQK